MIGSPVNLSRILGQIRDSWRVIAICVAGGLLLAVAVTLLQNKTYISTSQVLVSPNVTAPQGIDVYEAGLYTQQRAQAYVEMATSPAVLRGAAADIRAGSGPAVKGDVVAEWVPGTSLIKITATYTSASDAAGMANGVATQLASLVATVERPSNGGPPTVKVSTVRAADQPTAPASPKLLNNLVLGLLLGLIVGLPLVLARVLLDRSVSDAGELAQATGLPTLAVIGRSRHALGAVVRDEPLSPLAEGFRKLRTSLQFAVPGTPIGSVLVTAPQAGAGSTAVACNLAASIAEAGRRVILVDADLRDGAASRLFGVDDGPGLGDVLSGATDLTAALRPGGVPGLTVLGAGRAPGAPGGVLAGPQMVTLLEQLEAQTDVVIVDAPPVLPYAEAAVLAAIAGATILVARHGKTAVDDLLQARSTLTQVGTTVLGVVINAHPARARAAVTGASTGPARSTSPASESELADHSSR